MMLRRGFGVLVLLAAGCLATTAAAVEGETSKKEGSPAGPLVTLASGGRTALEYQPAASPFKPYVVQLYSPGGVAILRDSPADHKHHHGLMFAVGVDGVDFWGEAGKCGRQASKSVDASASRIQQRLDWLGPDDKILLKEERTIQVVAAPGQQATLLTWRSCLIGPEDKEATKLDGHAYYGLGMRFVTSMDTGGTFLNSAGEFGPIVRGDLRLTPAKWCVYSAAAEGKPVAVALFDHPKNPRHPARMFTMNKPFTYLSATINLWKDPLTLTAKERLDLTYGVALWDGTVTKEQIESLYHDWVSVAGRD